MIGSERSRPGKARTIALASLSVVAGWSCVACVPGYENSPFTASGPWQADRFSVGDTNVVRTLGGGLWERPMTLEPELSIGRVDGPEELVFDFVEGLWVTEAEVLVVDMGRPAVRRYDLDGNHLGDVGRHGEGPGEYRRPIFAVVLDDGRVVVVEDRGEIKVYAPIGDPDSGGLRAERPREYGHVATFSQGTRRGFRGALTLAEL